MGNVFSAFSTRERAAEDVVSSSRTMSNLSASSSDVSNRDEDDHEERIIARQEEMDEFRKQLDIKREQRKEILNRHRKDKKDLEKCLAYERKAKLEVIENNRILRDLLIKNNIEIPDNVKGDKEFLEISNVISQMKEEFGKLKTYNNKLRRDLAESNNALQNANSDIAELNAQNIESIKQIKALKDIVTITKTMVGLREQQLVELKNKLNEIERSLGDREANMLSNDLRQEYIRQLQNIRTLRALYEERAHLAEVSRQGLVRELEEQKRINESEINRGKNLLARSEELENKITHLLEVLDDKNDQIATHKEVSERFKAEMSTINMLFAQVLLGYQTKQDLDKLIHRLEENHGLLIHMAEKENGSEESSALPKLLLELVSQVDGDEECQSKTTSYHENETIIQSSETTIYDEQVTQNNTTPKEIVENLPKVWKVLMELLSHQNVTDVIPEKVTTCYKSVDTKSGPILVPSVSQTYIRLKDLIVEKLALIKEMNRMKQLNSHLETRLEEQEKRLGLVTNELSKTWHVVGRLRRHHHQLHTHEKILKYELQQKRKLLNELKEQLEYCREKWVEAREKNSQSEKDWETLRAEFSNRKLKASSPINNSGESGYSDERPSDESSESNDESECTTPLTRFKKKNIKYDAVIDSSANHNIHNQAAEHDDPPSILLDIANLPLDQDNQDANDGTSDFCCENNKSSKKNFTCEETEDEVFVTMDNIFENNLNSSCSYDNGNNKVETKINNKLSLNTCINDGSSSKTNGSENGTVNIMIDASAILESIRQQNERLAKKDKKLESLETNTDNVLKKIQATNHLSNHINKTLDHIINRPSCSRVTQATYENKNNENVLTNTILSNAFSTTNFEEKGNNIKNEEADCDNMVSNILSGNEIKTQNITIISNDGSVPNASPTFSGSKNLPNTEKNFNQEYKNTVSNENLNQGTLEYGVDVAENFSFKLNSSLETVQNFEKNTSIINYDNRNIASTSTENSPKTEPMYPSVDEDQNLDIAKNLVESFKDDSEPASTSTDTNHEVRFAARDLRLKRLEEQTKCLVNKMNKTATKAVKLHYKLEELHNIYGSESSRASTPDKSEDESKLDDETDD